MVWSGVRVASLVCVCCSLVVGGWLGWFYLHSATGGARLLAQARQRIAAPRSCASGPTPGGAVGELVVPAISLVAPVVEGDGSTQLADAVGHVPTSVWPGHPGTPVFVGHDVTWFHDLATLKPGDEIEYLSGCHALTYAVQSTQVVAQGASVANTVGSLALVTCWPLDALWFTGQRFLVLAHEVGGSQAAPAVTTAEPAPVPVLAVPPALAGVDTLAANPTPLGTLTLDGTPAVTFAESPGPLADAAAAQDLYFAALRAAEADSAPDWSALAPTVPLGAATPFGGASIVGFPRSLATVLDVRKDHVTTAALTVEVTLAGPHAGNWSVTVTEGMVAGKLAVTGWQMASV